MKKVLYTLVCLLIVTSTANATHLTGGNIRYHFNGTNYTIELIRYEDCYSSNNQFSNYAYAIIDISSQSKGIDTTINIPIVSSRPVLTYCTIPTNVCSDYMNGYYNAAVYKFQGDFAFPDTATDWVISTTTCCRATAVTNLYFPANDTMYIESRLNNTIGNNSMPIIPSVIPGFKTAINKDVVLPLVINDPDGDSIAIDTSIIYNTGITDPVLYVAGYSKNHPLGLGYYYIDHVNQTLNIKCANQGWFSLGYKVKEYRNGVLVGSTINDFVVMASSTAPFNRDSTLPYMASINGYEHFACPGKKDSITFAVADTGINDSVYIEIDTPTIAGLNFSKSISNGVNNGTGKLVWTIPANFNTVATPFFYVKIKVSDNNCPRSENYYNVLVRTRECNADSVWPGDANYDKRVDIMDVLMVGVNYNQTGTARTNASNNWVAQYSVDWGMTMPNQPDDIKHNDCNGDGVINANDLTAIATNWSKTHAKPGGSRNKTTGVPDLYYDVSNILFVAGQHVQVPIMLGNASNNMNDIYGVGGISRVGITGSAPLVPAVVSGSGWIGTSSTAFDFDHNTTNGIINWAICATDHQNRSGNGQIGILDFEVPSTAKAGDQITLELPYTILIDKEGKQITNYNALDTVAYVFAGVGVEDVQASLQGVSIVPNPSANTAVLNLYSNTAQRVSVQITDMTGSVLWHQVENIPAQQSSIALPASKLSSGIYIVSVRSADGTTQTLKWMKQ